MHVFSPYPLDQGQEPGEVLVLRSPSSPVLTIPESGSLSSRFSLPEDAEELVTRQSVLEETAEALAKAKLSQPARAAVKSCLVRLGWEDPDE